jgi:hypothetical protein
VILNHDYSLNNKGYSNSSEAATAPRHRWYFYKEGFSPPLVQHAIDSCSFNKDQDTLFDPFNGGGTVTLYSALEGYKSVGFEVNPFSSFISKTKQSSIGPRSLANFLIEKDKLIAQVQKGKHSPLLRFSTFSEYSNLQKWLFNSSVLRAFEGGDSYLLSVKDKGLQNIFKLALINSAMDNCNAKRDGKCLRYRSNWESLGYDKNSFINSLNRTLDIYLEDLRNSEIKTEAVITRGDTRKLLKSNAVNFKLCITSPPYLNSFDYTDVYRPELYLGGFLKTQTDFQNLKHRTLRSHVSINATKKRNQNFGHFYKSVINSLTNQEKSWWNTKIPPMISSYFEDMHSVLTQLHLRASKDAQLWIVVANSAYSNVEVPTDLILAEIGAKCGWFLREIGVLGYLHKRGTKYSPDIKNLRESVVIFSKEKF